MTENKLQIIFILSLITASWAKVAGYDYQPKGDAELQQPRTYLPPQYTFQQLERYAPAQETYKKEFYTFSAPEEDFEDVHAAHKVASSVQKNVRVIFIRAPEHKGLEQAALQLAKQVSEDKTAIYVLNKQHDLGELAQRLTAYREQYVQKPEVHFVKYRTAAEAEHAQQQIQAQYDQLRGSTHTSNEGAAPVLDFATKQQPSYGSAISIVPAYNLGSSKGSSGSSTGLYSQPLLSSTAGSIPAYNLGSSSDSSSSSIGLYSQALLSSTVSSAPANNFESSSVSGVSSSNNADLYTQQLLRNSLTDSSLQSAKYEKAAAQLAALNLLNSFKSQTQSQSFNTNSISSYNTISSRAGSDAGVDDGIGAGIQTLSLAGNPVDNGVGSASALEAYGVSPRHAATKRHMFVEKAVSKLNERQNRGGKLVFPSDGGSTNTYLAPIKRSHL